MMIHHQLLQPQSLSQPQPQLLKLPESRIRMMIHHQLLQPQLPQLPILCFLLYIVADLSALATI